MWGKTLGKLTALAVKAAAEPGRYGDGDGLFLQIGKSGGRSWIVRVQKDGRRRDVGLGGLTKVSLARARQLATNVRSQVEAGVDPVAERKRAHGVPTFREAAARVHAEHRKAWRNGKHQDQWLSSLERHAFPIIGDLSVADVGTAGVRDVLSPIWLSRNETARRVRQRIVAILDWATAAEFRDAPINMKAVNASLPRDRKARGHHAAMPFADVPVFVQGLSDRVSMGRLALEAAILTAARSGEVRLATWSEVDVDAALWTIPAARMKAGRAHVVPLSPAALATFRRAHELRTAGSEYVFPGMKRGQPLSDMTLTKLLRDAKANCTTHGFRSSFKDWAAESTDFTNELSEAALAHVIDDATEAAYRRGTMLAKRRAMMDAWGAYCTGADAVRLVAK